MRIIHSLLFKVFIVVFFGTLASCGLDEKNDASNEEGESALTISTNNLKLTTTANPISANVFCADPTAVEYEGRLYV